MLQHAAKDPNSFRLEPAQAVIVLFVEPRPSRMERFIRGSVVGHPHL